MIKDRRQRLLEVYEHLRAHHGIHTQTDLAEAIGFKRPSISAAINGNELYLTDNLFKKICARYQGVFNLDYLLTGEGTLLTVEEEVISENIENEHRSVTEQAANIIDLYAGLIKEIEYLRAELTSEINIIREERIKCQALTRQLQDIMKDVSYRDFSMASEPPTRACNTKK